MEFETYRGLDELVVVGASADGEGCRSGGVAPDGGGGRPESLALDPLRLVKHRS